MVFGQFRLTIGYMQSILELLKKGEEITLNLKDYAKVRAYCDNTGIEFVIVSNVKNLIKIKINKILL